MKLLTSKDQDAETMGENRQVREHLNKPKESISPNLYWKSQILRGMKIGIYSNVTFCFTNKIISKLH